MDYSDYIFHNLFSTFNRKIEMCYWNYLTQISYETNERTVLIWIDPRMGDEYQNVISRG